MKPPPKPVITYASDYGRPALKPLEKCIFCGGLWYATADGIHGYRHGNDGRMVDCLNIPVEFTP